MFEIQIALMATAAVLMLLGSIRQAQRLASRMQRLEAASRPEVLQTWRIGRR